jgi:hypothetical protein
LLEFKDKIKALEKEKSDLKEKMRGMSTKLTCFSPGQVKRILNPNKKNLPWSPEDTASAISLRSVGSNAYRYLRTQGHPLPALSTLLKWASTFSLRQGILADMISLMRNKALELTNIDKLCILSFDEICILTMI